MLSYTHLVFVVHCVPSNTTILQIGLPNTDVAVFNFTLRTCPSFLLRWTSITKYVVYSLEVEARRRRLLRSFSVDSTFVVLAISEDTPSAISARTRLPYTVLVAICAACANLPSPICRVEVGDLHVIAAGGLGLELRRLSGHRKLSLMVVHLW
jgi:hypothetical protein